MNLNSGESQAQSIFFKNTVQQLSMNMRSCLCGYTVSVRGYPDVASFYIVYTYIRATSNQIYYSL